MFKNIMNLEGVAVLTREQQKSISGQRGSYCRMVMTYANGSSEPGGGYFTGNTNSDISAAAGRECAKAMAEMGGTRCTYDCEYDGFGQ